MTAVWQLWCPVVLVTVYAVIGVPLSALFTATAVVTVVSVIDGSYHETSAFSYPAVATAYRGAAGIELRV